jgi:UDP-3-O-[3-hydroxymyristoyl] glucosamine N-acyltransferase
MASQLADLAALVAGELVGDGGTRIDGATTLADAGTADITLIDNAEKAGALAKSAARAAVVPRDFPVAAISIPVIRVDDVHTAFTLIVRHFRPERKAANMGVSPAASVSLSAKLGSNVQVHPHASIGDDVVVGPNCVIHAGARLMAGCQLGANVVVFPNAVLYEDTIVGDETIIHAGAIVGGYGFGYKFADGQHMLSAQLGNVVVGKRVEVGANSTIDRGTYGPTLIGDGTKIDNQVQIAHNCRIGRHNMLCSQVGIAGSTSTGDYVVMAGQVGVRDHVHIGQGAVLGAMSGISSDVPAGLRMIGIPATPEREQKLKQAALSKLPEMRKQMKELSQTVARLVERHETATETKPHAA